ncbi:TLC domain-containing protein 3A-like [Saccoglossus kowalevskii]|uniref:Protein FAM57A-like n=1 Tax=Saccoglossus kowalevskii TaxID=10224 RepID=A0ABM0LTZ2_SACKO|nr:PREDICTED: protein FAM57A-like [Saccoglossus kowalevskii]
MLLSCFLVGSAFFPGRFYLCRNVLMNLSKSVDNNNLINNTIAVKCVSGIQATLASISGLVIANACQDDVLYQRHWLTNCYAAFAAPYMLYDIYAMFIIHTSKYPHLYPRNDKGDFFVGCFYTMELANPFLCLRAVLNVLGRTKNNLYLINGITILITYFICRILIFPYIYYIYGHGRNLSVWQVPSSIPLHCNIGCMLILSFQVFWYSMIIKAASRTLRNINQSVASSGNKNQSDSLLKTR